MPTSKIILSTILTLLASSLAAQDKEIGFGGLSLHLLGNKKVFSKFDNKVTSDGRLISNKLISLKLTENQSNYYTSNTFFAGENSMGSAMGGYLGASGIGEEVQLGFVYGAYVQDNRAFLDEKIINYFSFFKEKDVNIVPIVGVELNFRFDLKGDYYIKLNNIVTPAITNHSIGLGGDF